MIEPVVMDSLPWLPIQCSVLDRESVAAVALAHLPADLPPVSGVVRQDVGVWCGIVQQWGLFPASDLSSHVLLAATGSVSRMGIRPLTWHELAALWDVPILVSDRLGGGDDCALLRGFCASAPAKVLYVGADALLTVYFRGGASHGGASHEVSTAVSTGLGSALVPAVSNGFQGSGIVVTPGPAPRSSGIVVTPGPAPRSNEELGLVVNVPGDSSSSFDNHVVKGDQQKSDNAAVPDQLWTFAFLCGYGPEGHGGRHLQALGLPQTNSVGALAGSTPPEGWLGALSGFRVFGLRRWPRVLLHGYFSWRRRHVRITKGCTPFQMVRPIPGTRKVKGILVGCTFFVWSHKGEAAYQSQWSFLCSTQEGLATVRAGRDAVYRSAHASWFKWL